MPTSDVMKAAKTAQVKESIDRGGRSIDANANRELNQSALDVTEDNAGPDAVLDAQVSEQTSQRQSSDGEQEAPRERARSPFEQRRLDIISGFRKQRSEDNEDGDDNSAEIRRMAHDGMPPELIPLESSEEAPEDEEAGDITNETAEPPVEDVAAQPQKLKIKVRGKEIEVTQDELLAFAQKGAAGDDYLDEAKNKLNEVNELLRNTKTRATSPGQSGEHHAGQTADQSETDASTQGAGDEHHVDPFVKMVESVQLGTPEEAATEMRKTVEDTATKAARSALEKERLRDEAARSSRALKDFSDANKDLADDPLAHAVIERKLYDLQVQDIKALGIADDQIPRTPTDIANWHLWYRTNGYKVRNITELLNTASDDFKKWKGIAPTKTEDTTTATRKAEPRVEVTVDRQQRRAAIPQQPSRTATSKPAQQSQVAQPRDRSDIVAQMVAARAKPRGKVMG